MTVAMLGGGGAAWQDSSSPSGVLRAICSVYCAAWDERRTGKGDKEAAKENWEKERKKTAIFFVCHYSSLPVFVVVVVTAYSHSGEKDDDVVEIESIVVRKKSRKQRRSEQNSL